MTEITRGITLQWRRFLQSEAGMAGMLYLREKIPHITKGLPHEVQYDAGYAQGYIKALDQISEILAVKPEKEENIENP